MATIHGGEVNQWRSAIMVVWTSISGNDMSQNIGAGGSMVATLTPENGFHRGTGMPQ